MATMCHGIPCPCLSLLGALALAQGDDDFACGVARLKIPERLGGLEQPLHKGQIRLRRLLHEGLEALPTLSGAPRAQKQELEKLSAGAADQDISASGSQHTLDVGERASGARLL